MAWSCAGGLATLSVASVALIASGAFAAMWDVYIVYNLAYTGSPLVDKAGAIVALATRLNVLAPLLALGWLIGLYYLATGKAKGFRFHNVLAVAVFLCPLQVGLIVMSGFTYTHYYLAILPAAVVLTAFLAWLLIHEFRTRSQVLSAALLAALTFAALLAIDVPARASKYLGPDNIFTSSRQDVVAASVREHSDPDDKILVWGYSPWIYLESERDAPTRFFFQLPLILLGGKNEDDIAEFVADVIRRRPAIIVDTADIRFASLDPVERKTWQPTEPRYMHDPDVFRPFYDFVESEYEPFDEVSGHTLYRLRER